MGCVYALGTDGSLGLYFGVLGVLHGFWGYPAYVLKNGLNGELRRCGICAFCVRFVGGVVL